MELLLRILVIEDSPADFMLIQRQICQEGLAAFCSRVDKQGDLEKALVDAEWDLILSDYNVPGLDFYAVFDLIHGRFPDLPFILISGNIGEEQAVELLKKGVADFVLKDRMIRLVPAIRRCLKDTNELHVRRATEMALWESNERFRMIFENSIDGIMLTQLDGTVLTANPEACRIFGVDEERLRHAGRPSLVDMGDERVHAFLEQRALTGSFRGEITMLRGDGTPFPAEISSSIFHDQTGELKNSVIVRDVTERKSLEAQLRQSQKMEDIGTLAGGIAHDFNNILTAIVGYSTLLQMDNHVDGMAKEYVDNLVALVERAAQLTRSLLAFSRNQVMTPRRFNLNDIISTFAVGIKA
jgi:PAS domain S-box-containing protein